MFMKVVIGFAFFMAAFFLGGCQSVEGGEQFSLNGVIVSLDTENLLVRQEDGLNTIKMGSNLEIEHHIVNSDGEILERLNAATQELVPNQVIQVSGIQDGDSLFAEQITVLEIEESLEIETSGLQSGFALLVEVERDRTHLDIRGSDRMFPASMTKIMTAIVAIQNLEDMHQNLYMDPAIFAGLQAQNAAMAGFSPSSWVSVLDLLYGMMLPSGGEATLTLASAVGGDVAGFVGMMNEKARDLGMRDSHFTNPIGMHDPSHFTTAADLVILLRYALENETFREIFTSQTHTTGALTMSSTLFRPLPRTTVTNGEIIGGRTGFTWEAGRCLISLAVIDGVEYILVTGSAPSFDDNRIKHLLDALYIFDQI
jgi:D-alanyl-D-alanine carboxypeptidase (penicillin-binding protein 5/6)